MIAISLLQRYSNSGEKSNDGGFMTVMMRALLWLLMRFGVGYAYHLESGPHARLLLEEILKEG